MNIYEKLLNIQQELKAPKNQWNDFGKYNYRSCEDVLEGLKPLLLAHKVALIIADEIEQIGNRYYVKSIVTLCDAEKGNQDIKDTVIVVQAYAREDETKKGMDLAQVTGSASSYARKYALNGLFAIDDTKDADATNGGDKPKQGDVKQPSAKGSTQPSKPKNEGGLLCSGCSASITQGVKEFSTNKYKKALCQACQKKEK